MSLAKLKTNSFSSSKELCDFVNNNNISVIVQIIIDGNTYRLFYR